jgi:hypothetical protein
MRLPTLPISNSVYPWLITLALVGLLFSLTYFSNTREKPKPRMNFYTVTDVVVNLHHSDEIHNVHGMYNNIIEGKKFFVLAERDPETEEYRLQFSVNSPRPAFIYVDEEAIEVFLAPDSTLQLDVFVNPATSQPDSLRFSGSTANISEYYREKAGRFENASLRSHRYLVNEDDLVRYGRILDSLAAAELTFLDSSGSKRQLPKWFLDFERNEIIYHKAYLKLSHAYNREVPADFFDDVLIDNPEAVFSYYYYLFLKSYISMYLGAPETPASESEEDHKKTALRQIAIADTLLSKEVRDVFVTRIIFKNILNNRLNLAKNLLKKSQKNFTRKKYLRFLSAQIDKVEEKSRN